MTNLYTLIEHIEKRPSMYFVDKMTLALVEAFILGYQMNACPEQLTCKNGLTLEDFHSWLTGAIPPTLPENHGWRRRIEHVTQSGDEALHLFFELIKKFANGQVNIEHQSTEPKSLKWSRGTGGMKQEDFQQIEEIVVRFEIWRHEFSETVFRMGYNAENFCVYVEPSFQNEFLHTRKYTQVKPNY